MVTCDELRGTGHEWVLYSRCLGCGEITDLGPAHDCEDCRPALSEGDDQC